MKRIGHFLTAYWLFFFFCLFVFSDEKEEEEYEKEEVGEDGEIILVSGDKVSGPWNKSGAAPPPAAAAAAAPVGEWTSFSTGWLWDAVGPWHAMTRL